MNLKNNLSNLNKSNANLLHFPSMGYSMESYANSSYQKVDMVLSEKSSEFVGG